MIMAKMPGLYSTRSSEERAHEESESMHGHCSFRVQ